MASAHPIKNTSKPYICTTCRSENVSVIREDPKGINPRIKCNSCQFVFDGKDSLAALEAGAIKPSSPETLASASEPEVEQIQHRVETDRLLNAQDQVVQYHQNVHVSLPKRPAYVFIDKNGSSEFCNKREFKAVAIRWAQHSGGYAVYELKPVKLTVDVNVV